MAVPVALDDVGVGVDLGGRFTVGPVRGRDVQGVFIGVVACVLQDGLALAFEFCDERGTGGGDVALVAQALGDVHEHVGFVGED